MIEPVLVSCPSCRKKNRVDGSRVAHRPRCGACGAALEVPEAPAEAVTPVNDQTFRRLVIESPVPVLVDFFATWCGPCKVVAPVVLEVARLRAGKVQVAKLDVDESPVTAQKFGVTSVPTLVVVRGPQEVSRLEGARPLAQVLEWLDRALAG